MYYVLLQDVSRRVLELPLVQIMTNRIIFLCSKMNREEELKEKKKENSYLPCMFVSIKRSKETDLN